MLGQVLLYGSCSEAGMIETVQVVIIMLPWSFQSRGFWCEGGTGVGLGIMKDNIGKYKCSGSAIASI